ncbi:hypothetical protein [Leptospira fletcheri]|nr:hypothetical protein [Leptospira fletcheri]
MILVSKVITGLFWFLWFSVLFQAIRIFPQLDGWIVLAGWVILGLHVLETGIYSIRAPQRGGFRLNDAVQVLLFGVFHLIPVSFSDKKE